MRGLAGSFKSKAPRCIVDVSPQPITSRASRAGSNLNDTERRDIPDEQAQALGVLGRPVEAIALYDDILAGDPGNESARIVRATLYRDRGHLHRYLEEIEAILEVNPSSIIGLNEKYATQAKDRRFRAAAATLQTALQYHPGADEFRILLVSTGTELNWLDVAKREADRIQPRDGTWWPGAQRLARERYDECRAQTRKLLSTRKQVTAEGEKAFAFELGFHLAEMGRLRMSAKLFKLLMRDNPRSFPSFARYAFVLERQQGIDAAVSFLENLEWLFADDPDYGLARIKYAYDKGMFAGLASDATVNSFPLGDEPAASLCGYAMAAEGEYEKLEEYSTRWLNAKPKSTWAGAYVISSLTALEKIGFVDLSDPSDPAVSPGINVVQFWDKPEPPQDVVELMSSWSTQNPTLGYRRFSEASAREFIVRHYGDREAQAFELCHHPAMKSDYFRLSYLYKNGGVYVDADDRCLVAIRPILANLATTNLIATVADDRFPGYIHNWFLAANPGSQVLRLALAQATSDIHDLEGRPRRPDIWETTGPGLITRCIATVCSRIGLDIDEQVRLMTLRQYRTFVRVQVNLPYKQSFDGNWRNFC